MTSASMSQPPLTARLVQPEPLVVVIGPTASGKSALAARIAESLSGEVVGCDALQIRAGLPLLTAKPTAAECAQAPHHLIGVLPIDEPATAARYAELADDVLRQLRGRAVQAVLCGGTGLYLRALCDGLFDGPPAHAEFREAFRKELAEGGSAPLHDRLRTIDPEAAGRIAPADYVRIERALEVHALTGRTISELFAAHRQEQAQGPRYRTLRIGLDPGPEKLRERILARVEQMLAGGLLDEVAAVTEPLRNPPIGFELVRSHLDGAISLPELRTLLAKQTADYARRQRTWFRKEAGVRWYADADALSLDELRSLVLQRTTAQEERIESQWTG